MTNLFQAEMVIKKTNPKNDHVELLRQFREANIGKVADYLQAIYNLIIEGTVVLYLDHNRKLVVKTPATWN